MRNLRGLPKTHENGKPRLSLKEVACEAVRISNGRGQKITVVGGRQESINSLTKVICEIDGSVEISCQTTLPETIEGATSYKIQPYYIYMEELENYFWVNISL